MGFLNDASMSGRAGEMVETSDRRKDDLCCMQETTWRRGSARMIVGKNCRYKFHWSGNDSGYGGVGSMQIRPYQ